MRDECDIIKFHGHYTLNRGLNYLVRYCKPGKIQGGSNEKEVAQYFSATFPEFSSEIFQLVKYQFKSVVLIAKQFLQTEH